MSFCVGLQFVRDCFSIAFTRVWQVGLRFTTVYGDGARDSMLIGKLIDGTIGYLTRHVRDFVHVSDIARANYLACTMPLDGYNGEVLNVGTGSAYSVQQIADAVSDNQTYIPKRDGEMETTFADITRIGKVLGWKPEIDVIDYLQT